jgi:hypothetical protein
MNELAARPVFLRLAGRYAGPGHYPRLARARRFEFHLRRTLPPLTRMDSSPNPNAMALLAVETFVRPAHVRAVEYACWVIGSIFSSRWLGTLSVGPAQIQLAHFVRLGVLARAGFTPARMRRIAGRRLGYETCLRLLEEGGLEDTDDVQKLARFYSGANGTPYAELLSQARDRSVAAVEG